MNLVTGASGFIGSAVVRRLLARRQKVRCYVEPGAKLDNLQRARRRHRHGRRQRPRRASTRALDGCDTLFHLAAIYAIWLRDPSLMYRVNVEGSKTVLWAAYKARLDEGGVHLEHRGGRSRRERRARRRDAPLRATGLGRRQRLHPQQVAERARRAPLRPRGAAAGRGQSGVPLRRARHRADADGRLHRRRAAEAGARLRRRRLLRHRRRRLRRRARAGRREGARRASATSSATTTSCCATSTARWRAWPR